MRSDQVWSDQVFEKCDPIKFDPIRFSKFAIRSSSIRSGFQNLRSDQVRSNQVFKMCDPIKFDPIRFSKFAIRSSSIRSGFSKVMPTPAPNLIWGNKIFTLKNWWIKILDRPVMKILHRVYHFKFLISTETFYDRSDVNSSYFFANVCENKFILVNL
jgi:hypothetical protein